MQNRISLILQNELENGIRLKYLTTLFESSCPFHSQKMLQQYEVTFKRGLNFTSQTVILSHQH
jgi:hypothetical protein